MTLNGQAYIGAIKIRGNLVATALRSARGRPQTDVRCDCCGRPENLPHILQSCPRTHTSRIARHDKIVDRYDLTILDVTIVADNADLKQSHQDKQVYYDVPAIREWVQSRYEPGTLSLRL